MTYGFYKRADGVIITYDMTNRITHSNVSTWMDSINQHSSKDIPRVLVANKIDLPEER